MDTYIAIEAGDFGEVYIAYVMHNPDIYDVKELVTEFIESVTPVAQRDYKIITMKRSCQVDKLCHTDLGDHVHEFAAFLRKKGFKNLLEKATAVSFND